MAKHARVTGPAEASEIPRVVAGPPISRPGAPGDMPQGKVGTAATAVVKWGNGGPAGGREAEEVPPTAALDDKGLTDGAATDPTKPAKTAKPKDDDAVAAADAPDDGIADKPVDKPPAAERRSTTLANLEAERRLRETETALKAAQGRAARADELEKALGGPLAARVKALKLSKSELDELTEKLLTKDESLYGDAPDKPAAAKVTPEIEQLTKTVQELQKRLDERDGGEGQAAIARAQAGIAETLKDEESVPLVNADVPVRMKDGRVESGLSLTMQVAHQMWLDSGKNGAPQDFVKRAATNVQTHLEKIYPTLTAKQRAAAAREEDEQRRETGPSLGRRAGRGVVTQEPRLPRDPAERDLAIKKAYGWD